MKKILILLSILAGAISGTQASIIYSDTFDYPNGDVTAVSGGLWVAHSSAGAYPVQVSGGNLIVTEQPSSGYSAEDIHHDFGTTYMTNSGLTLYSTYMLKLTGTNLPAYGGVYISHFRDANTGASTGYGARVFLSATNAATGASLPAGKFRIGIGNGNAASYASGQLALDLTTNVTYQVVTRFVLSTGTSTIWINPSSESDTSATATDIATNCPVSCSPPSSGMTNALNVIGYCFRQGAQAFPWNTWFTNVINNLEIATAFTDIAGANTAPLMSGISPQNTPRNTPITLTIEVEDAETTANLLTVTASSSNTGLVPNGNIALASVPGTGGTNRTVTITPVTGQQGFTTITLVVTDVLSHGILNHTTNTFLLTVGAPAIGAIQDQIIRSNTATATIAFTVGDTEGDTLTLTKSSSNPTLVPLGNIVLGVGVPNVSSNVTVTPVPGLLGVSTITISATDGHTTTSTSFAVTVSPIYGLVYSEDFAYTSFDVPNGLYNAHGGSGGPWSWVNGTPQYTIQVTNTGTSGFAYLVATNAEDLGVAFSGGPYYGSNGVVLYTSFSVKFSYLPGSPGSYFLHFAPTIAELSSFNCKVFAGRPTLASTTFRLGIANYAGGMMDEFPRDLSLNTTYWVVTRFDSGTGESVLWVNPGSEQSPSAVATDSPGAYTVGSIHLRQADYEGDMAIGPIKIGTSWSDVYTAPVLNYTVNGSGQLVLSWSNPLLSLQHASVVTGPYTTLAATSPYTNSFSGPQYFRLGY